jgi:hypothetical protein
MKVLFRMKRVSVYQIAIHALLLILAGLVAVLSIQNGKLKGNASGQWPGTLREGDLITLSGLRVLNRQSIDTSDTRKLIFVFTTRCEFCRMTIPIWKDVAKYADSIKLPIIGISLDSLSATTDFIQRNTLAFPVCVPVDPQQFRSDNRLSGVPLTIIRSAESHVEKLWSGRLTDDKILEVDAAISRNQNTHKHSKEVL